MFMNGRMIYESFTGGVGPGGLSGSADMVKELSKAYNDEGRAIRALTIRMESAWQGEAAGAAVRGVGPLAIEHELASSELSSAQDLNGRQAGSFGDARNSVMPVPPEPVAPDPWLGFAALGPVTTYREQVADYNAAAQHNVDVMRGYENAAAYNATNMPKSYGALSGDQAGIAVTGADSGGTGSGGGSVSGPGYGDGSRGGGTGGTGVTEWATRGSGSPDGGGSSAGVGGASSGGAASASGRPAPPPLSTTPDGFTPPPQAPGPTNPLPPGPGGPGHGSPPGGGGGLSPVPGFGPGGGGSSNRPGDGFGGRGPGGSGPGGGSAMRGPGGRFGGGEPHGPGGRPGAGSPPGGVAGGPQAAGRGGAGGAAGRGVGMGGMPMGAGGRGGGDDDLERRTPSYLQEHDPESVFGTDEPTAPPVIGEDDEYS